MTALLDQIALCTERGKVNLASPYPPDLRGQDGVDELTKQALATGTNPNAVLTEGLMVGMSRVGAKFSRNEVFVPDLLMAAKAMTAGMAHLKPYFESGEAKHRGTIILGTVQGDLHDIGKNLVRMVMEGGGWRVIDLGVDVSAEKFVDALKAHPGSAIGLSALLTTTMVNMEKIVQAVKATEPTAPVLVGGAPLTQEFCTKIGADGYSPDPQGALELLEKMCA
jgi:5-methyltetrahydrofolate--homocysteine methyltransferase